MFRFALKSLAVGLLILLSGCREPASNAPSSLGSTGISVTLRGPDEKNHYRYVITDGNGVRLERFLGPSSVSNEVYPEIKEEGEGRFRVTWGSGIAAAYTLIDTKNRKVISDTNLANSEQAF